MGSNRIVRCGCGEITGVACAWAGDPDELVEVAYIPDHLVCEASVIRRTDPIDSPLGRRVLVHRTCADIMTDDDQELGEMRAIVSRRDWSEQHAA